MIKVTCDFCSKVVASTSLVRHQKSGKCLAEQGKRVQSAFQCEWCGDGFLRSDNYNRHLTSCKQRYKVLYVSAEERLEGEVQELTSKVVDLKNEVVTRDERIRELEEEVKALKIANTVLKENPGVINNTVNIKITKLVVQEHVKENFIPLSNTVLRRSLGVRPDLRLLLGGAPAVANLILSTSLSGRDKVACTDLSRSVSCWKDVDSTIVVDPKLCKLMARLCRPIYNEYKRLWEGGAEVNGMDFEDFQKAAMTIGRLGKIAQNVDKSSRFYNEVVKMISRANCDLSFMLTEEDDEHAHDSEGNSVEWMSSDED